MDLLDGYPVRIEVPVAWGDMDALGHVNNTVYFRWFESARIAYFEEVGFLELLEESGVGPILASTHCRFRLPLDYPATVRVGASISALGEDRFVMRYAVASRAHERLAAEGEGLVVCFDYRRNAKAPIPEALARRIAELEGGRPPELPPRPGR